MDEHCVCVVMPAEKLALAYGLLINTLDNQLAPHCCDLKPHLECAMIAILASTKIMSRTG